MAGRKRPASGKAKAPAKRIKQSRGRRAPAPPPPPSSPSSSSLSSSMSPPSSPSKASSRSRSPLPNPDSDSNDELIDYLRTPLPEPQNSSVAQDSARASVSDQLAGLGSAPSVAQVRDLMARYMESYATARQQRLKEQQDAIGMNRFPYK